MIDLDIACFTTADACSVAGIKPSTLAHWLCDEPAIILMRQHERPSTGLGCGHPLTLRRIFQVVLTAELMRHGVAAQRAGNLAALFTDQGGEQPAEWGCDPEQARRPAGHLFPSGRTILLANQDGRLEPIVTSVMNAPLAEVYRDRNSGALVVDVGEVVGRVLATLRLPEQRAMPAMDPAPLHASLN